MSIAGFSLFPRPAEHFEALFQAALFDTRVLDRYYPQYEDDHDDQPAHTLKNWSIRRNHSAQKLWHSYLSYRVQNEHNPNVYRFVELRQIAQTISKDGESGMELKDIIHDLCWLALENVAKKPCCNNGNATNSNVSLLSAAAYLGCFSIVQRLLLEGNNPIRNDDLFPCAVEAAAFAGNVDMLQFLQEALQEAGVADDEDDDEHGYRWHASVGYVSIGGKGEVEAMVGAAMRGDVKMLHLALHPSTSYATPQSNESATPANPDQPVRSLGGTSTNPTHAVLEAMQHAKTLEVYSHLASFFPNFLKAHRDQSGRHLELYAEYGNIDIVRYLLDSGVSVGGSRAPFHPTPLHFAARHSYADIVHLLLERGADVRRFCRQLGDPLNAAVVGGDINIVKALLEKGAVCNFSTLEKAVFSERTDLVDLMMQNCTLLDWHMPKILESARKAGLHSMVEYVENVQKG